MKNFTMGLAVLMLAVTLAMPAATYMPTAVAEPNTSSPGTTEIAWKQLGLDNRLELVGANQPVDVGLPVPQGAKPTAIAGQIGSVANITRGRVDVLDARGIPLGSIPIPNGLLTEPFVINTSAAQLVDGVARLSFVIHDDDPDTTLCAQVPAVNLVQLTSTYSGGNQDPRTVADFLPGYLDKVSIRVGPNPTPDQQQAALSLVAKLTQLYRPIPVRIDVDTSADSSPILSTRTSRVIEIRDGGPAAVTVQAGGTPSASLAISGNGAELSRQIDLFANRQILLAQTESASVIASSDSPSPSSQTLSFAELGVSGQVSVQGRTPLYIGVDVSKFAVGSISGAKIHLLAKHTAVQPGQASILISSGSTVLASRELDKTGSLDIFVDVPADTIASNIGLALELRYTPDRDCPPLNDRMTFALDPRSTVAVTPGDDSRSGFTGLPVAFTPDFDVAVDRPDRIRYAARAVNLIGQQTAFTLRPHLRPIAEVSNSRTGLLLVSAGDWLEKSGMSAPVMPSDNKATRIDGNPTTDANLNGPLGVVQAFTDSDRQVLALNPADGTDLLDRTFDYIQGLEARWASLSGDVVATGAANTTVNITVRNSGPQPRPDEVWRWWSWITIAVVAASLVAVAAMFVFRWRRTDLKA